MIVRFIQSPFGIQIMVYISSLVSSLSVLNINQSRVPFKMYTIRNSICQDIVIATYKNIHHYSYEELKHQLVDNINIPTNRMVVIGDEFDLSPEIMEEISIFDEDFEFEYNEEDKYIPIFRLTPEEICVCHEDGLLLPHHIPLETVVSMDGNMM